MIKKNAPYSGARRAQNQQVADSGLGTAASFIKRFLPEGAGEKAVGNTVKSTMGYKEKYGSNSSPEAPAYNQQEAATPRPDWEAEIRAKTGNRK